MLNFVVQVMPHIVLEPLTNCVMQEESAKKDASCRAYKTFDGHRNKALYPPKLVSLIVNSNATINNTLHTKFYQKSSRTS